MITKGEFAEVISDMVVLLQKQVPEFSRTDIINFLEVLNTSDDENLPVIILGKNGQFLFKDIRTNETKIITKESIQEILDYDEFVKTGCISLRKAS